MNYNEFKLPYIKPIFGFMHAETAEALLKHAEDPVNSPR